MISATQHFHIHDEDGRHIGDVCGGTGRHFRVFVHRIGAQKYESVGKPTRSTKVAMALLSKTMEERSHVNRGIVALCADYYDPSPIYELRRA